MEQTNEDTRHQKLHHFLIETLRGRRLWLVGRSGESILEMWAVGSAMLIIQLWPDDGWDYYLQGGCLNPVVAMADIADWYKIPADRPGE